MASSVILHKLCSISLHSPKCYKNQTRALTHSQFLSSNSFLKLKKQSLPSSIHVRNPSQKSGSAAIVFAAQTNILKGKHYWVLFSFFFGLFEFWICFNFVSCLCMTLLSTLILSGFEEFWLLWIGFIWYWQRKENRKIDCLKRVSYIQ